MVSGPRLSQLAVYDSVLLISMDLLAIFLTSLEVKLVIATLVLNILKSMPPSKDLLKESVSVVSDSIV